MKNLRVVLAIWGVLAGLSLSCFAQAAGDKRPQLPLLDASELVAEQHYARALELNESADLAGAEEEFRRAWEMNPMEDKYVQGLVTFYMHRGSFQSALGVLQDHVAQKGPTTLGYTLQGELLFLQRRYDLAFESLLHALELSIENYRAHYLIGMIHAVHRRYPDALNEFKTAVQLNPQSAQARFWYGRSLYKIGSYVEARTQFLVCLRIEPGYPTALENLGLCHEALQEYERAAEAYQEAIRLDESGMYPPSEHPYIDYALMLERQGGATGGRSMQDRVLGLLETGLARNPQSARANFELGRVFFKSARYHEAEERLRRSVTLDPQFSRPHYFLGRLLLVQERVEAAKAEFDIFRQLDKVPENREPRLTR